MLGIQVLKDISIEDYTTPCPVTVGKDESIQKVIEVMDKDHIRHIPVMNGDKVAGIISERDILTILATKVEGDITAGEVMTPNPFTVGPNSTLDEVAYEMSSNKIGSAVVIDDHSNLLGIFTTTDALNALIEIVRGEIEV